MGLLEWGKRLDDRVVGRWVTSPGSMHPLTGIGIAMFGIFGGQLLLRLVLPLRPMPTFGLYLHIAFALAGSALWARGTALTRRSRE